MRYLKQSTSVEVGIGPFLDETDGKTAETALTITQPDVRLKKNAAAWAQKAAAQTLTHEEAGWYELNLDATDTDTIGHLLVAIHESGALPVWQEYHVLAANVYESLFGAATDKLDVNVEEWNTTAVPAEHTAGYPIVTVKDGTGTGELLTTSGKVDGVLLTDTVGSAMTLTAGERTAIADATRARPLTEGYAADGVAPTLEQAVFMIMQGVLEFGIVGVTKTTRKLDKSTAAYTHTLNDAQAPTSVTRAS
jgi:hypothetical protein